MEVLHIACGFSYSNVYRNLFQQLNKEDIVQSVYVPQHNDKNLMDITDEKYPYKIYSNKVIKFYDKFLYFSKIHRMKKDVEHNFDLSNISIIHAHSLFSDGGVAYELYKKFNIPYIVVVRNTDINKYYRYGIHLRSYAQKILNEAKSVIFLSPKYKEYVINKYICSSKMAMIDIKSLVIPNGIESFWLNNKNNNRKEISSKEIKLVSVGVIDSNKNSIRLIMAANELIENHGINVKLTLVGDIKDRVYYKAIKKYKFVTHLPYQKKENLINIYRENDIYAMPSINESFGLVYAEAMSQGLPVIYTKGQGFDGHFQDGTVGYSVDCNDSNDIAYKILQIIEEYEIISNNCIKLVDKFNWEKVASVLKAEYKHFNRFGG